MSPDLTAQEWADELADAHLEFYRLRPKDQLVQTVILEEPSGAYDLILCPWENQFQKTVSISALKTTISTLEIVRYAFFSEVWVSLPKDGEIFDGPPSLDPAREERVFTVICDRRLPQPFSLSQKIVRGRHGGVRTLVRVDGGKVMLGGRLTSLFEEEGTLQ